MGACIPIPICQILTVNRSSRKDVPETVGLKVCRIKIGLMNLQHCSCKTLYGLNTDPVELNLWTMIRHRNNNRAKDAIRRMTFAINQLGSSLRWRGLCQWRFLRQSHLILGVLPHRQRTLQLLGIASTSLARMPAANPHSCTPIVQVHPSN